MKLEIDDRLLHMVDEIHTLRWQYSTLQQAQTDADVDKMFKLMDQIEHLEQQFGMLMLRVVTDAWSEKNRHTPLYKPVVIQGGGN